MNFSLFHQVTFRDKPLSYHLLNMECEGHAAQMCSEDVQHCSSTSAQEELTTGLLFHPGHMTCIPSSSSHTHPVWHFLHADLVHSAGRLKSLKCDFFCVNNSSPASYVSHLDLPDSSSFIKKQLYNHLMWLWMWMFCSLQSQTAWISSWKSREFIWWMMTSCCQMP